MEYRVASAGRGMAWFRGGVRMLDRNPRGLLLVALGLVLLEQLPGLLVMAPLLSTVLAVVILLLFPALLAGMQFAIAEADAGRPVLLGHLFEGLRRPHARSSLIVLGLVVMLAMLAMVWAVHQHLGPEQIQTLAKVARQQLKADSPEFQALMPLLLKAVGAMLAIAFVLAAGLFFAVPRVMFDGRAALPALVESFMACAANVLPLLLYGMVFVAVTFAAMIGLLVVAAFLGLLGKVGLLLIDLIGLALGVVGLLVNTSGNYLAWREVFGHADGPMRPAGPARGGIVV